MPSPPAPSDLPPLAAAVPSNNRSLRRHTSATIAGRNKGKNKETTDTPDGLSSADVENLARIGLGWRDTKETASARQSRVDDNFVRMAAYSINLEKSAATQLRIVRERTDELQLLVHEVRVACERHAATAQVPSFNITADPAF